MSDRCILFIYLAASTLSCVAGVTACALWSLSWWIALLAAALPTLALAAFGLVFTLIWLASGSH